MDARARVGSPVLEAKALQLDHALVQRRVRRVHFIAGEESRHPVHTLPCNLGCFCSTELLLF